MKGLKSFATYFSIFMVFVANNLLNLNLNFGLRAFHLVAFYVKAIVWLLDLYRSWGVMQYWHVAIIQSLKHKSLALL
jgi:hypothetical protein